MASLPKPGDIVDNYIYIGRANNQDDARDPSKWHQQAREPGQPMVTLPTFGQSMQQEVASRSPLEVFNAGVGAPLDVAAMKLKGAFTDLQPEDQARIEAAKAESRTIPGMLGSALGNTLATGPLFSNLSKAQALGPLGRIGAQGGASSLQAGATAPENAREAMMYGGLLGLAGGGLGEGLNASIGLRNARATPNLSGPDLNRLAVAERARGLGLKINPLETNPSPLNQMLGATAGRQSTAQGMSLENVRPVIEATAKDVGLTGRTLTPAAVANVIDKAGEKYDALRKAGDFVPDNTFIRKLIQIGQESGAGEKMLPSLQNPEVKALIKEGVDLGTGEATPASKILETVKDLRFHASKNYMSPDPTKQGLARAQKAMANAYEDMMERQLAQRGDLTTLAQFKAARTTIAKASLLQDAMNAGGGSVPSARYLGAQLRAGEYMAPGSGARTVGEAANEFGRDFQDLRNISDAPAATRLDVLASGGSMAAGMPGLGLAIPASKIGVNRLLASGLGQRWLGTPPTGLTPNVGYGLGLPALLGGVPGLLNQ